MRSLVLSLIIFFSFSIDAKTINNKKKTSSSTKATKSKKTTQKFRKYFYKNYPLQMCRRLSATGSCLKVSEKKCQKRYKKSVQHCLKKRSFSKAILKNKKITSSFVLKLNKCTVENFRLQNKHLILNRIDCKNVY